jgi:hypothetical protein
MPVLTEITVSHPELPHVRLVRSASGCSHVAVSPAPSNASSASFRPTPAHAAPITYGSGQLKKKKKRVVDSDDERCKWGVCCHSFLASVPLPISGA